MSSNDILCKHSLQIGNILEELQCYTLAPFIAVGTNKIITDTIVPDGSDNLF